MTDDELVDGFADACLRAGKSSSGLCISASGSSDWEMMQRWRRAVKARITELRGLTVKEDNQDKSLGG